MVSSFDRALRSKLGVIGVSVTLIALTLTSSTTFAYDDVRVRLLEDSRGFRVRARAAIALGRSGDLAHVPALERGLADRHPWVRAACATALGRLDARASVPALREATRDRVARVARQARLALSMIERGATAATVASTRDGSPAVLGVRYALVIGALHNRSGALGAELEAALAESLARQLSGLEGALVVRSPEDRARAPSRIPVFRIEGTVTELARAPSARDVTLRCVVSFLVLDDRQRTLRGTLRGAATGTEGRVLVHASRAVRPGPAGPAEQDLRVARKALDAAVRSALRNAPSMIESAISASSVPSSAHASVIRR